MGLLDFSATPDRYAVMGNPIAHSKSPLIHSLFARQCGQRLTYEAILVEPGGFGQAVGNFMAQGGRGLNVTVPFKQEAWAIADQRSPRAERAGAVNTLRRESDGSLYGDNTDGIGLVADLKRLGIELRDRQLLILGAGGAVRGVIAPLLAELPANLTIVNRTVDRARELVGMLGDLGPMSACGYAALEGRHFDLIINATAASLQGELPPLPEAVTGSGGYAYDMMYGAQPTPFMLWAAARGATAHDGLGMLVEQAAAAFALWRGVTPDTAAVIGAVRQQLAQGH
jgi:shikimate dehydrogenase